MSAKGVVPPGEFTRPEVLAGFASLRTALATDPVLGTSPLLASPEALASVASGLHGLFAAVCGATAGTTAPFTRPPHSVLMSLDPQGGLAVALREVIAFAVECKWTAIAWDSPELRPGLTKMLTLVMAALGKKGLLARPVVCIDESVPEGVAGDLRRIVTRHEGSVVSDPDKASHVVHWSERIDGSGGISGATAEPGDRAVRTRALRTDPVLGEQALVHFQYTPDSYDSWITLPSGAATRAVDPPRPSGGQQWKVAARFVRDVDVYNEWPNEWDYDVTDDLHAAAKGAAEATVAADAGGGRKRRREDGELRPMTVVLRCASFGMGAPRRRTVDGSMRRIVGLPMELMDDNRPPPQVQATADEQRLANIPTATLAGISRRVPKPPPVREHPLVLPSCAGWFDMTRVHPIEQRGVPEFFDGRSASKTPEVYMRYRNFIVNTYRQAPATYLTATACRRSLAGDVCAILRVHQFLEHWGIINFNVEPDSRPAAPGPPSTAHFPTVPLAGPPGAEPSAIAAWVRALRDGGSAATDGTVPPAGGDGPAQRLAQGLLAVAAMGPHAPVYGTDTLFSTSALPVPCGNCGTNIARGPRYFCPDIGLGDESCASSLQLCEACFAAKKYPNWLPQGAFVRIGAVAAELWSDEETLRLLQAVEKFIGEPNDDKATPDVEVPGEHDTGNEKELSAEPDGRDHPYDGSAAEGGDTVETEVPAVDWQKVAAHVGTKTAAECVARFLQLPIEAAVDGAVAHDYNTGQSMHQKSAAAPSTAAVGPLVTYPFADASNPEMLMAAALVAKADPKLVAAATQAAIAAAKGQAESHAGKDAPSGGQSANDEATKVGVAAALATAAARANALAESSEREAARLMSEMAEVLVRKVTTKLKQFEELRGAVDEQMEALAVDRAHLAADRVALDTARATLEAQRAQLVAAQAAHAAQVEAFETARNAGSEAPPTDAAVGTVSSGV